VQEQGTFWLSPTPDTESKGWNASTYRICSYAVLKIKNTQRIVLAYNTHLDVDSADARLNGAKLILSRMASMRTKYEGKGYTDITACLTGDFNCTLNSDPYKYVAANMSDAKTVAVDLQTPLTQPTYNKYDDTPNYVIDYIFVNSNVDVMTFKVTTEKINGGYVSDHYGIYATIAFGDHYCGGIAGTSTGTVVNTYFKGKVNGYSSAGGTVGMNTGYALNSYFAGSFGTAAKTSGGVSGTNKGTVKNCYTISGLSNNGGGTAKTADAMKSQTFANSLNFITSEWKYNSAKNGGYPYLKIIDHGDRLELKSSSKYVLANGVVSKVKCKTAVSSFVAEFTNLSLSVFFGGTEIPASDNVATGDKVVLKDGATVIDEAYIVVTCDVDCDGVLTQNDYVYIKSAFKKKTSLDSMQQLAADLNGDGKLNVTDYIMVKRCVAGTYDA
ncbi:MAG: hypothetical protein IJS94_04915, partial [Clostridia bacterium]|nr:hypothetical protein [Clostridia bacterium]